MSEDEIKYIDQNLEQIESSLFKYLTSSMSLLSEISKGDAGLIIEYLKVVYLNQKIPDNCSPFLIMDEAPVHTSELVVNFLEDNKFNDCQMLILL